MIKAITFDLDGVYFTSESFKRFKTNLPKKIADESVVNQVLYKSHEMALFKLGKISEADFWNYARKELVINISNQEIFKLLRDSYEINPQVRDYVRKAKLANYTTCICTNNFITRIRELDTKFNFLADFDIQVISYQVGITKPDSGIFQTLVDKSGVLPQELVYSDDDASKLQGALELGINAFVYKGFDKFKLQLHNLGVTI